ncbi:hypothetical protein [Noviherbaspirillum aridicola]|uniref:Uncharacterized protein n=1 Tax=Noviherbaspirillum aridicola TaxID=2849687 RepID=A0ABQ4Q1R1_9BURK|nr:hypothetical protein [Noviherbaspirillum aridicola]GIZ51090.1 hypothetical protein NCCP691_11040 [Noviherbaspirillum aridicola]
MNFLLAYCSFIQYFVYPRERVMGEWARLRYGVMEPGEVLAANADRIRALLAAGPEEPEPPQHAVAAIERVLADIEQAKGESRTRP